MTTFEFSRQRICVDDLFGAMDAWVPSPGTNINRLDAAPFLLVIVILGGFGQFVCVHFGGSERRNVVTTVS